MGTVYFNYWTIYVNLECSISFQESADSISQTTPDASENEERSALQAETKRLALEQLEKAKVKAHLAVHSKRYHPFLRKRYNKQFGRVSPFFSSLLIDFANLLDFTCMWWLMQLNFVGIFQFFLFSLLNVINGMFWGFSYQRML